MDFSLSFLAIHDNSFLLLPTKYSTEVSIWNPSSVYIYMEGGIELYLFPRAKIKKVGMARAVGCCLNLRPPSTTQALSPRPDSIPPAATARVTRRRNEDAWKRGCLVGVASMTIGLGMFDLLHSKQTNDAILIENYKTPSWEQTELLERTSHTREISEGGGQRWSEKRACPPWTVKSFEITVPENLPRPHARKRWESVHLDRLMSNTNTTVAPPVKFTAKSNPSCFSM